MAQGQKQKKERRHRVAALRTYTEAEQEPMMVEITQIMSRRLEKRTSDGPFTNAWLSVESEVSSGTITAWQKRRRKNFLGSTARKLLDTLGMRVKIVPK